MAARDGVPGDPAHPDQRRYLDAQRIYRAAADPLGSADLVVDNADPARPVIGRPAGRAAGLAPDAARACGGWSPPTRETAERINRLLGQTS